MYFPQAQAHLGALIKTSAREKIWGWLKKSYTVSEAVRQLKALSPKSVQIARNLSAVTLQLPKVEGNQLKVFSFFISVGHCIFLSCYLEGMCFKTTQVSNQLSVHFHNWSQIKVLEIQKQLRTCDMNLTLTFYFTQTSPRQTSLHRTYTFSKMQTLKEPSKSRRASGNPANITNAAFRSCSTTVPLSSVQGLGATEANWFVKSKVREGMTQTVDQQLK